MDMEASARDALMEAIIRGEQAIMHARRPMEDLIHSEITMGQLKALLLLGADGGCPVSHVADSLGVGRPAASSLVDRLVQLGLAERREDTIDRRRTLTNLTAAGSEMSRRLVEGGREKMRQLLQALSDEDLQALARGIAALAEVAEKRANTEARDPKEIGEAPRPAGQATEHLPAEERPGALGGRG